MSETQNPLDREFAFFEQHKSEWLSQYETNSSLSLGTQSRAFTYSGALGQFSIKDSGNQAPELA
jgi:hypothetical protein